jgi:CRISPR-associated protein Cas5t
MECLRVKLYTPTGIFKTPLSIKGIETYPLLSYSTVIGLIYHAMGKKWKGEHFQISIQGDYQAIFRDYVWFKKYNSILKKPEHRPLQVPILYNLCLLIHIKANEEFLKEIENSLKEPKTLLFLSGGEYPVKVEEVKRVKYYERFISKGEKFLLKYNAYIPKELLYDLSFSGSDRGSEEGILYTLPYFYKSLKKPRVFSYVDVYYFLKGTRVYGSLVFDEDGDTIFWVEPQVEEARGGIAEEEEEYVKFYAGNWLMASACVGALKVLKNAGEDVEKYVEGRFLKIPRSLWGKLQEFYADNLLKDKERAKSLLEREYKQKGEEINPFSVLIARRFLDFYHDSVFTNPSSISKFKGYYSENLEEVLGRVREHFLDVCERLFNKEKKVSGTCFFCYERQAKSYVDATMFTPLFTSLETAKNFVWDPIGICKECEFLLYFACVGFYKKPDGKYLFVYFPDNLIKTYNINFELSAKKDIEQDKLKGLWDVVKHILEFERQKGKWALQNIYFVEIEKVDRTTANIYSFHVSPQLAKAIRELIDNYPKHLQDIFSEFLFYIYTGRSLYEFLFFLLIGFSRKESYKNLKANTIDARIVEAGSNMDFLSQNLLFFINFQEELNKQGGLNMSEQKNYNYVDRAFWAGQALKRLYNEDERTQKKLEPLTYRLLEAVRRKDKEYYIHNLIRAYLEVEKEIPYLFKETLDDKNFSPIAYAFLIGLNSEEKGKEEEANDEGGTSEST